MTEWEVVGVIIALVGLIGVIVKAIVPLTRTITELTVVVKDLRKDMDDQRTSAHNSHKHLWEHNEKQDKQLNDHEKRIYALEEHDN